MLIWEAIICETLYKLIAFLLLVGENLDKENTSLLANEITSPPLSLRLQELSNNLKSICNTLNQPSTPEKYPTPLTKYPEHGNIIVEAELRTPERSMPLNVGCSPWKTFSAHSSKLKVSMVKIVLFGWTEMISFPYSYDYIVSSYIW